jgi:hypothetical protein
LLQTCNMEAPVRRNSTKRGTTPHSMTFSIGGFLSLDNSFRNLVVASNWRSGSPENTPLIISSASCEHIQRFGHEVDVIERTGGSQLLVVASSSESAVAEGRKLRLFAMFSSRFCLLISTCCSSLRRLRSSCFKPPLFL